MELIDVEEPAPGPDEVVVEVDYAGLCGSDAGIYKFKGAYERVTMPTVIGHEYTGRVVDVGDRVSEFEVGDQVAEMPIQGCGECYHCRTGEPNVCIDAVITGVDRHGAYRSQLAVSADALIHIPDGLDPRHAALVEPTSIGTRAVIRNSRVRAGSDVLVEGPGPIGLLTAQVARAQGGDVVVSGVGRDADHRLPLAEDLGFETLNVAEDDVEAVREQRTGGIGYDVVFDTTGHPSGLTTAVEEARKGGQIVVIGQTDEVEMAYSPLVRAELDVQCSYASVYEDFENALDLIDSGDVDLEPMIDERFSLLNADEAFETFLEGGTTKPLFDVSELRE